MRSSTSSFWPEDLNSAPSTSSSSQTRIDSQKQTNPKHSNVFQLLARREISPRTQRSSTKLWEEDSISHHVSLRLRCGTAVDARRGLISWIESESLQHLSAKYCPLQPPPRSTIAAAFSPDGKTLASTHGDHTVKIVDCLTGRCLNVLSGHRRTPWVVRFHPICPEVLASGSLDQEVRIWDANTAECIGSCDFYRPIASISFHAQGEHLAVASGHKLYVWHYSRRGETVPPTIILETRRSLRAVHFHPYAAPLLLTAEVNELDSSDSVMTLATSPGYLHHPPPTVYITDSRSGNQLNSVNQVTPMSLPFLIWPPNGVPVLHTNVDVSSANAQQRADPPSSVRLLTYSTPSGQYELVLSPIESSDSAEPEEPHSNSVIRETENNVNQPAMDPMDVEVQLQQNPQTFPFSDPAYWDLPLAQGWLIGQSQAGQRTMRPVHGGPTESLSTISEVDNSAPAVPSMMPASFGQSRGTGRSGSRNRSSRSSMTSTTGSGEDSSTNNFLRDISDAQPSFSRIQSEIANSLAATASAELPCTVKLRIWSHDISNPCARLHAESCRLTIPHAVLCSEMGAHFSPCGRFLAACVACILPNMDADPGFHSQLHHDVTGTSTSPTRHPISGHQVMYELRIYSLEEATFGLVLASRAIRAAHCLTSIQFSPTSEHLLLAYGRRHSSLLKSIVIDGDITVPIYTILEVYRISDMELVRILPSAEDEVNVACFHPSVGGGLVYGTKEGKLRILHYGASRAPNLADSNIFIESMI